MVNKTVLITGVSGFIGRKLASTLLKRNFDVIGVDVSDSKLASLKFYNMDLKNESLKGLLIDFKPGYIVNLAGNASVGISIDKPEMDFNNGPVIFHNIIENVRLYYPSARVLQVSSAAVYGQPEELPVKEDAKRCPLSPYGYNKYICELIADNYHRNYGINVSVARIFSAYGAGLRKQILWDLCGKCLKDSKVVLGGTGEETRDFISNEDISRALIAIMENSIFKNDCYNVGSGKSTTIKELALMILERFGMDDNKLEFNQISRAGDPKFWEADIEKLKAIGFRAEKNLRDGVCEYIEWFRNNA